MELTAERVREILEYNPSTGIFLWKVKHSRKVIVGSVAGALKPSGYVMIGLDSRRYGAHRLAYLYVHGQWPARDIDHKNGNPSDNRICNLRLATKTQNAANRKLSHNNKSGFKGVSWYAPTKKWVAYIKVDKRTKNLGYFYTAENAHAAYCAAAADVHGEFARAA